MWWAVLTLLVAATGVLYRRHQRVFPGGLTARRMLRVSIAMALLLPPVGWFVSYTAVGMNCGL